MTREPRTDSDRVSVKKFVIEGVIAGVIGGVIVSIVTAILAPSIARRVSLLNPTCEDPGLLERVSVSEDQLQGDSYPDVADKYAVSGVVDGIPGSVWMPPAVENESTKSRGDVIVDGQDDSSLTITFANDEQRDVQMLCVVNGIANEPSIYRSHLKARNINIHTDNGTQEATLGALNDGTFQNFQTVPVKHGRTVSVRLEIVDFQVGQFVETKNPRLCNEQVVRDRATVDWLVDQSGCIMDPQPVGGIAEVEVYSWEHTWWSRWKALLTGRT